MKTTGRANSFEAEEDFEEEAKQITEISITQLDKMCNGYTKEECKLIYQNICKELIDKLI